MKLVILGRDGVINHNSDDTVRNVDQWEPIDGSIDAIARLHLAGYTVVVATNQSGLAYGFFDLDDLEAMHNKLTELVENEGGEIGAIFYCPHEPNDNCKCRKPLTGMLDAIEAEFNTSLQDVIFIGNSFDDLQAGSVKDCRLVIVQTGREVEALDALARDPDHPDTWIFDDKKVDVFSDLAIAVNAIIEQGSSLAD